jgi:hypothetical protein
MRTRPTVGEVASSVLSRNEGLRQTVCGQDSPKLVDEGNRDNALFLTDRRGGGLSKKFQAPCHHRG